jgi:uncharacterized radical SAM superfamily Fe-S cluster-containing enzyme
MINPEVSRTAYDKIYYRTTTICPTCERLIPGEVVAHEGRVTITRECPEHGYVEGVVCSDVGWFESLSRFDVEPRKPKLSNRPKVRGCPADCGLCPAHRQSAGTAAIEISNRCDSACPVCLADNQQSFEMSVAEVRSIVEQALKDQGGLDILTLSGGEPTIHPDFFEILDALRLPGIGRIVVNTNGIRIARDDEFLARLSTYDVYVSLHFDGQGARTLRGVDPGLQERALERLLGAGIGAVPLVLAAHRVNDVELGQLVLGLLARRHVKSMILSLMAYTGHRGSRFPGDPLNRLTIPGALDCIQSGSGGRLRKSDFMPLPMPNPLCAAVGYFLVDEDGALPLVRLAGVDRMVDCIKNQHFAKADARFEDFFRETIDRVYAESPAGAADALRRFRRFLERLFPEGRSLSLQERTALAEEHVKTVYLMQFMDGWTFDSTRLAKCSCQHLLPEGRVVPSCGYYVYHRRFDPRFARRPTGR